MEPKYKITTQYNEEEIIRYNRTILFKEGRLKRSIIMINIALIVMLIYSLIISNWLLAAIWLVFLPIFNWYFFKGIDRKAARQFRQNKLIKGQAFELAFHDDHYEGASELGYSTIPYTKLHSIIETPTNFYLMEAPMTGIIIKKGDCPDGFIDFIHDIKNRYNL